ncbi:hypothetical protein PHYBOEH_011874 [Phytophthora boehmeriae]|uniref:Calmodulin n=1 Tax=Phytophthora boehmeriae TaxID=109152 RepID=A0A8T1VJE5_9STRA|nr:hypothetical protein PHYBOEH_011874 [Phytophthora boehmeriae]
MADEEWGGGSYDATTYDEAAWYGGYAQNDPDEYWRVDAEVYRIFLELAPIQQGASVELNDLPELCRRVGRALRDDHEQFRVMQELDTTNSMQILRHDFVNWLLAEMQAQEQARLASKPRPVPAATPVWEEVVQEVTEVEQMLGSQPTVFYYNAMSGESIWELPSFVRCLWNHLGAQELAEQDAQVSVGGIPAFVQSDRSGGNSGDDAREMVQLLRELFVKYDEEKGGYLDAAEFEDLCVHVGQPVNGREGLLALIREVDPFNVIVSAPGEQEQEPRVSWDGLRYYWVTNAPFQKRTRLAESLYTSWERVDVLHQRTTPVLFRHTATLQERWGHPAMEQRVVDRLNQLFSSNKLDMVQKIDLFIDVQWKQQQQHKTATADGVENRHWNLETCWRMLSQLSHPISRREHLQAAMFRLQQQFQGPTLANEGEGILSLDEAVVRAWLHYCAKKVAMRGWEELQDGEGQTYYYHEVDGTTQWDPPQLQTQMVTMLNKLGGGQSNLSADEQIARVFRQYDVDGGGEMTLDEFQHFYRALLGRGSGSSETLSDDQVRQVFSVLDTSGDGSVTLEEFQLWWKTKLQLEVKANEEDATDTREQRRRDICLKFLENADAIVHAPAPTTTGESDTVDQQMPTTEVLFESNLLPRLATLLGEFPLRGLAHRRALNDLVREPMEQLVSLERFLAWYDGFEKAEREKVELQRAKQRAQAELQAQLEAQAAARQKQRRRRKQMHTLDVMTEQAAAMTDHEAQKQREKKISVLFKTFDTDGSGLLDEQELLQLTKALGHDMDAAQVNRMIRVMDASGDGRVSLEEFLAFWKAFEHRRPAAATAAALHQDRRDAVSQLAVIAPIATMSPTHKHTGDTLTSLSVSLEMAKDRALKLTMADMRGFLTDWRDDLREKRIEHQAEIDEAERIRKWRELHAFVPTKKRVYGTKRLDVTWIEPEVVDCVAAIIVDGAAKPDVLQIQIHENRTANKVLLSGYGNRYAVTLHYMLQCAIVRPSGYFSGLYVRVLQPRVPLW